ncbi:GNAT family N-acetyltransferase/peptidase C39 family protein [Pseudoalteromonas mariniglutinosa]|uniref:GNAT family N-acetyltransferase/peptidase C39 family protein n=1 Tax=Pseudoalteromonas mariniglutinosa TaxID=206042 RepID=UPI00384D1F98
MTSFDCQIRLAASSDLPALLEIEQQSFSQDRLSSRSLKRWLTAHHGIFMVAHSAKGALLGYGLVWCHKGTRLARLYSLAILPSEQGKGIAGQLLTALEKKTAERGRLYMRLEVAVNNNAAIQLYKKRGYRVFGQYSDYYDDHSDALRMQKNIRPMGDFVTVNKTPWYQQTTEFTCGPAAIMMAMSSLKAEPMSQHKELDIWREATTIFMTSGHGGCHPLGLALAAIKRGFNAKVIINSRDTLFIDGVRNEKKKAILHTVHNQFVAEAIEKKLAVKYQELKLLDITQWLADGMAVVLLISTYRFDGKKSPHWVCVTHIDEHCLYVHDSFCEPNKQLAIDCQHVPIAKSDFSKMASFGSSRLSTAIAIQK